MKVMMTKQTKVINWLTLIRGLRL